MTTAVVALRSLFVQAGLDPGHVGSPEWNPLGTTIQEGDKVVIKPNWVRHWNGSGEGMECLVTHTHVLEAILNYVAKARPRQIVVGDAPVQGCDFAILMSRCRLPEMIERFTSHGVNVQVKDFRRTILSIEELGARGQEECRPLDDYVLYDVGRDSSLDPISFPKSEFRVTMYHPDRLRGTHAPGRHQYLIARDVAEADVVINVPKLKTHKKVCITGALKNAVGINGHKEYLPHHRKGGALDGGDCYPGRSQMKGMVEELLDATNRAQGTFSRRLLATAVKAAMGLAKIVGEDNNYDGSWHGNDTVWRMCLDIQRLLHYGRTDGTLGDRAVRRVLTITDAIIAGQGEGPLSPTPIEVGMITLGTSPAAVEWVHALLMGLPPERIPLTREAFAPHRYPLADFQPADIHILVDGNPVSAHELFSRFGRSFLLPRGWQMGFGSRVALGAA